jgi:hypothetical protein
VWIDASELAKNRVAGERLKLCAFVPQSPYGTGANVSLAATHTDVLR